ncbi:MAG TPA: NPCBM/NEW2 domain-containing protein, partial [Armatimonadota bacterium]|nr:NPCBM/NEW2 domain-containing protein [Armatimonadota bacterium]
ALALQAQEKSGALKQQMRLPWPPGAATTPREWLVCGEFPLPLAAEKDAAPALLGLRNDYLQGRGGEAAIRPRDGVSHKRPNGTVTAWRTYTPAGETLYFSSAFYTHPSEHVVWYAYTTLHRARAGKAALALSSNGAVRVWVNGALAHEHYTPTEGSIDDLFAAELHAGENAILVKVVQRHHATNFTLRAVEIAQAAAQEMVNTRLAPALFSGGDLPAGQLAVITDDSRRDFLPMRPPVTVEMLAPGGTVMATATVPRGGRALFDIADWPDGPYEARCTMTTPAGNIVRAYRLWYHGDAVAAANALVEQAPSADDRTPAGMIRAMLARMVTARTTGDAANAFTKEMLYPALMEAAELTGEGPAAVRSNGMVRLAWRDELDDSPQFCRVYLPCDYTPKRAYQVVVSLHGRADNFPPYEEWGGNDARHDGLADRYGVIVVYPHGRGNAWYRGMGDRDVMRCVELVKAHFSVDEDAIFLLGYSMGGAGAWYVGTRHPDVFAALAPFYGGYDFRFQLADGALASLSPKAIFRRERLSYIAQLESLYTTPVFASHGDIDQVVPVDYSRYTVRMLERWGYPVRYWESPGKGHGGIGNEAVMAWLSRQRRVSHPPRVRLRAAELRSAAAHWLRIEQRKDPYAVMQADAEFIAPNYMRLDTINALQVTIVPPTRAGLSPFALDPAKPVTVVWNGADVRTVAPDARGRITLRAKGYTPAPLSKRPELDGPVNDVFNTPMALVIGTIAPDPLMRRMCARAAERFQAWWDERHHCGLRVFLDTAITADEQAKYSLLLFGGPAENAVAKAMAKKLPLTITPYAVTVDGKHFRVRDAAVQMCYPSPLNPDRYVIVRTGTSPAGMFFADYVLNDTDFSIVDARNAAPAQLGKFFDVVTGRNNGPVLAAGYFDHAWRLLDDNIERDTDRAFPAAWTPPARADARGAEQALPLAEVVETAASGAFLDMLRNVTPKGESLRLGGRRYAHGLALPNYWLPKRPHWVEYDLGDAGWTRLRGVIGLEADKYSATQAANTSVVFVVKGDGIALFTSAPFSLNSPPKSLDVDIAGVRALRLEILNATAGYPAIRSIDWAEVRVER